MARHPSSQPTDVELQILGVLWELGPSTVRQVHKALKSRRTGYSTTLKMLQVMKEKGLVTRDDAQRPQVYSAAHARERTELGLLDALVEKAFGGSASKLVMRALESRRVSPQELAEMQRLVREAERSEEGEAQ